MIHPVDERIPLLSGPRSVDEKIPSVVTFPHRVGQLPNGNFGSGQWEGTNSERHVHIDINKTTVAPIKPPRNGSTCLTKNTVAPLRATRHASTTLRKATCQFHVRGDCQLFNFRARPPNTHHGPPRTCCTPIEARKNHGHTNGYMVTVPLMLPAVLLVVLFRFCGHCREAVITDVRNATELLLRSSPRLQLWHSRAAVRCSTAICEPLPRS